jgi:hypothetical protein
MQIYYIQKSKFQSFLTTYKIRPTHEMSLNSEFLYRSIFILTYTTDFLKTAKAPTSLSPKTRIYSLYFT